MVLATELIKEGGNYPNVTDIGYINKYKSRQHLILLLALKTTLGKDEIEYLAKQTESFFFYSNTIGIQAKNNERLFAKWSLKLREVNSIDEIKTVLNETMRPYIYEKIGEFKSIFLNIRHGSYNPLYRLRYVLGKIENTVLLKSGLPLKGHNFFNSLQVEHILPQTPKNDVLTDEFIDKDDYYNFVYKLGNVVLIESQINQAVNNFNDLTLDWFNKKQQEYSNLDVVTSNLLNHDYGIGRNTALNKFRNDSKYSFNEWNKKAIIERQAILLELAFETWKFNDTRIDK